MAYSLENSDPTPLCLVRAYLHEHLGGVGDGVTIRGYTRTLNRINIGEVRLVWESGTEILVKKNVGKCVHWQGSRVPCLSIIAKFDLHDPESMQNILECVEANA